MSRGPAGAVPVIDLRQEYGELVSRRDFGDYVRQRAGFLLPHDQLDDHVDVSGVVVVDDAAALPGHTGALASVLASPAVRQMVCVVVGTAEPDGGATIVLPSVLNGEFVTVLWAGDPDGIPWRLDGGAASLVRVGSATEPPLTDLLEALRAREVFQQVLATAAATQTRVAAPAVRLRSGRMGAGLLAAVQRRAMLAVATGVDPYDPQPDAPASDHDLIEDLSTMQRRYVPSSHAEPGGRVRAARQAAESSVAAVEQTVTAAVRPWAVWAPFTGVPVSRLAAAAAGHLGDYRAVLAELFQRLDQCGDDQRRAELRREGIELPAVTITAAMATDDVRRAVHRSLESGRGLEQTVRPLRAAAARMLPMGSAARRPDLDRAVEPITALPPMPGGFGSALVPLLILLAPLLAGRVGGIAAVLLLTLGAGLLRAKRRHLGVSPPEWGRDLGRVLTVLLLATSGLVAGELLRLSGTLWPYPLIGVGLVLALLTPMVWWALTARRWHARVGVPGMLRPALHGLDGVCHDTITEWAVTEDRRRASDLLRATAAALDAVAGVLRDGAAKLPAEMAAHLSGRAVAAVRQDLTALVRMCMQARWPEAAAGDLAGMAERNERRSGELLAEYERHLHRWGVQEPPPGWPARPEADQLTWWQDGNGLRDAMFADGRPVQLLCGDQQTSLLSRDPHRAATIRFAPRHARSTFTERDHDDQGGYPPVPASTLADVVWTGTGTAAGLVHLVPLRSGVRYVQSEGGS
ncbi:hypothetical protein KZ829_07020 [Actinoplanes hulinensis]|uniref:Uncharacterized protein n=1 Tax=Actinoplanes hulinensis TaxID=1144547 RepID=A0ABS7AZ94_9ACTN|nr:hypothetical protein [Actinoplanes hulinensis]MBW6433494.1 hypothetical protein [Actinoplanes hulinensis]